MSEKHLDWVRGHKVGPIRKSVLFTLALLASDHGSGEVTLADLMRFTELDEVRLRSAVTTLDNWEIISGNFDGANNLVFRIPPA